MSLPTPAARRALHRRTIVCDGFHREDGLWDIEARIVDTKSYRYVEPFRGSRAPATHVHDMEVRLTLDSDLIVRDIAVTMNDHPYPDCLGAPARFKALIGASVGRGWRKTVQEAVGGAGGCTHVRELLFPMATVAFQTIYAWPEAEPGAGGTRPAPFVQLEGGFVDGCIAWAADGSMVAELHPHLARKRAPK